ncbi:DUF262 domain-containing protein [Clostridium diolis]|uniref:DUF262 domain-containing protein n=1 Tax=Clostridium diolis TaxID=223919 RepID=A0AAV3W059_9CLOT|nr:DUF262 domain-containing protein [Clostridium diolis]QES74270.1 DUF262 domain-containing protein [Clostridium diolis]GEA30837.1 hypothetical protein CDIOL_17600 [Clostridium diolis]
MSVIIGEKISLKKLFSDEFFFMIPEYQRPYSWEEENCEQLFDDIYESNRNNEYFLGTIILQELEGIGTGKKYAIIDGQQRITTLQILLACLRDAVIDTQFKNSNQDKIFQKENLADGIPEKVRIEVKESLFFRKYIQQDNGTVEIKEAAPKNSAQENMVNAVNIFKYKLANLTQLQIQSLIQHISQRCIVIYIATKNFEDAFKLFTIVNDRGLQLRRVDILKATNLSPSVMNESDLKKYAALWEQIEEDLGSELFEKLISYIRTIEVKEKAKDDILKEYENLIFSKNKILKGKDFIEYLNNYKAIYEKLLLDKDVLKGDSREIEYINLLNIMTDFLPSTDWIPPILYYYKRFKEEKILEFIKALERKFVADWVLGVTSTKRVVNMNSILRKIEMSNKSDEVIKSEVMGFDIRILRDKINGDIYSESYCKYLLLKLEYLESEHNIERRYNTISVEHVLPQSVNDKSPWRNCFSEEEHSNWKHKIANLILLSKRKNSSASNYEFKNKKERYFKGRISDFSRSQKILTYTEWTCKVLEKRQEDIIKLLVQ